MSRSQSPRLTKLSVARRAARRSRRRGGGCRRRATLASRAMSRGGGGGGSGSGTANRVERGARANVVRREIEHALIDDARLVGLVAAQQRVGERDVRLDQPRPVVGPKRELDALLMMLDRLRLEPRDLFGQRRRQIQIAGALGAGHRQLELADAALRDRPPRASPRRARDAAPSSPARPRPTP